MGKRITDEQITLINEVYLKCGVKSKTAQIVGVSPSTVSKYLIPNYVSQENTKNVEFNKEVLGADKFINEIKETSNYLNYSAAAALCTICTVTNEEWEELKNLQRGIMI